MRTIYLGLGSNLGNRVLNINSAISLLKSNVGKIIKTSMLYSTSPQYVLDQPCFLNAAIEMSTTLNPKQLLIVRTI